MSFHLTTESTWQVNKFDITFGSLNTSAVIFTSINGVAVLSHSYSVVWTPSADKENLLFTGKQTFSLLSHLPWGQAEGTTKNQWQWKSCEKKHTNYGTPSTRSGSNRNSLAPFKGLTDSLNQKAIHRIKTPYGSQAEPRVWKSPLKKIHLLSRDTKAQRVNTKSE